MIREKDLYPTSPVRCIITGPSECGKSVFLTNLILNIITEYGKKYIYSPSLHQDLYQETIKCFKNYIPIHIIPNILNEEDIDVVIEEIVNKKDFQKSDTEKETFEKKDELKVSQEFEKYSKFIVVGLNEKKINNPIRQAMFKRGRCNRLSIFIISQDYYKLPMRTLRANRNIYHTFEPNNFRDILYFSTFKSYTQCQHIAEVYPILLQCWVFPILMHWRAIPNFITLLRKTLSYYNAALFLIF